MFVYTKWLNNINVKWHTVKPVNVNNVLVNFDGPINEIRKIHENDLENDMYIVTSSR